ncbi:hypothetical protein AB0C88_40225 [Streptomyces chartreusis]|uniref:hypothetical protein n=1 Tax=Streptomyces chartreusis TaxID=1969 RepID=UPI0033F43A90
MHETDERIDTRDPGTRNITLNEWDRQVQAALYVAPGPGAPDASLLQTLSDTTRTWLNSYTTSCMERRPRPDGFDTEADFQAYIGRWSVHRPISSRPRFV